MNTERATSCPNLTVLNELGTVQSEKSYRATETYHLTGEKGMRLRGV